MSLHDRLLAQLEKRPDGYRKAELRRAVGATAKEAVKEFGATLKALLKEGVVVPKGRGRYVLRRADGKAIVGILSVNPRGFGFVSHDVEHPDIFIPPGKLGNAFPGDRVRVAVTETTERGPVGLVEQVLERGHSTMAGECRADGSDFSFRPLRRDFPEEIPLLLPDGLAAAEWPGDGDWVVAELLYPDSPEQPLQARLAQRLNAGLTLTEDLEAIIAEFGLHAPYSEEEQRQAASLQPAVIEREDCTSLLVVTIDPVDAKDFDDAISFEALAADTARVGVHIADVAAYVAVGSELDEQARARGFTAYLPGKTLPMLPKPLAANLCSLRENEVRPAHSVWVDLRLSTGEILATRRCHSLVKVGQRLSFEQVAAILAGQPPVACLPEVVATIGRLGELADRLRQNRRRDEQFLDLATVEVRVLYQDDPPAITGFQRAEPNPAHELVEEFMLMANVAVARELTAAKLPAIYRVHDTPKQRDMQEFRDWSREALRLPAARLDSRQALNHFFAAARGKPVEQLAFYAFLRALPRAIYSHLCGDHFGLGKSCYCHFTSPIRRYPDLTVHQQLWRRDCGLPPLDLESCAQRAQEATAREAVNDEAYYAALDRVKMRYLNRQRAAGEKLAFEGIISRATAEGLVVFIPEFALMGFVPKEGLGEEPFIFTAKNSTLKGRRSGCHYRCGDRIRVTPAKVDVTRGNLLLKPLPGGG